MGRRVLYLDGLRAVAILLVVVNHVTRYNPLLTAHKHAFLAFILRQDHGVELFFVLSGFCLTYPTLAKLADRNELRFDVGRFAARRFLRIFPSFWIAIPVLLAFLTLLTRLHLPLPGSMPQHGVSMTKIVEQVFLLDVNPVWLNGSYWTLPLEVRWYFFCPLLLWLWVRSPKAFAAAGLALLGAHFTTRFANVDLLGLPAFMLGIVAADLQIRRPAIARFALAAFCVLVPIALIKSSVVEVPRPDPLWALLMFSFVVAVGQTPALGRALSLRVFAPIAGASYSIYLIHSPIVAFADHYLPYRLGVAGSLLLDVCIGVSCGIAFSYIAERPFRSGALRQRILKVLDKHIPALLRRMGMEPAIVLKRSTPLTAPFAEATGQPAVA